MSTDVGKSMFGDKQIISSDSFYFSQLVKKSVTSIENRPVVAKGKGVERAVQWEGGISRCKLYTENGETTRSYCITQRTIFNIL